MLYRLTYVSTALTGPSLDNIRSEMLAICEGAARFNSENQITGVLVQSLGYFAQCIEGPRTQLLEAFRRINNDHRHKSIELTGIWPIEERSYSDWRLAGIFIDPDETSLFDSLMIDGNFDPYLLSASAVDAMLTKAVDFAESHDHALLIPGNAFNIQPINA